jgi:hypothetical protein
MERRIGAILRQARIRREIELAEVEAATRIRLKYLRAIEAEDWDALPEGVYARGFIRTYASFLGLDGDRLADDYRHDVERVGGRESPEAGPAAPRPPRGPRRRVPAAGAIAVAGVLLVAAIAIAALPIGGSDEGSTTRSRPARHPAPTQASAPRPHPKPVPAGVSMRLAATGEVWVCLLDEAGRPLVDGQILAGGAEEGPFRSGSFTVSFGNGEVTMTVDGREADIPATSSPIGYSVDAAGELTPLSESERPTCV